MEEQGFIKMQRKFMKWEWYKNINVKTLFLHCIFRANFEDAKWQGIEIKRGQFITSIRTLSNETGLSERQVRTAMDKLILTSELTSNSTNKYSIVTVVKYNDYQRYDKQEVKQKSNKRQTNDNQMTTDKELKELKNAKNDKKRYLDYVMLNDVEYSKLKELMGDVELTKQMEALNNYIGSTGKKYKSHYFTLRNWFNSNNKDSKPNRQDIKDIKDTYITHIPDEEANNGPFKVGKN